MIHRKMAPQSSLYALNELCGILLSCLHKIPKVLRVRSKEEDKHHFLAQVLLVRTGFPEVTTRLACGRSLSQGERNASASLSRAKQMPAL